MLENPVNDRPLSKISLADSVLSILKAAASNFPITNTMASMLSDYQNHKQNILIEDVLNRFFEMIDKLDERVRNIEYIKSQDCICDILLTIDRAKDELDEDRRTMYAKYLTSCCHKENAGNKFKRIFLEYIGKMDRLDFFILGYLKITFNCRDAIRNVLDSYNYKYKSNFTRRDIMNHFYYLASIGVIEMSSQEEVETFLKKYNEKPSENIFKKNNMYQRTTLGDDLYKFIEKSEI